MIRVLVFISKLPSISMEEFIRYYEEHHVPMVNILLPMYAGYRRNYRADVMYGEVSSLPCDVVTELLFKDEADYAQWLACLSDPEIIGKIRDDEANFLDSAKTIVWRVDDRE